nr:phosphate starvation-inducible protein PhoH [Enterococcus sp.]
MTEEQASLEIKLTEADDASMLFGTHDKHIKVIEETTQTIIRTRGEIIQIKGDQEKIEQAAAVIGALQELIKRGIQVHTPDVVTALKMVSKGNTTAFIDMYEEEIIKDRNGKPIRVKNVGQKKYIDAVRTHDVTFGIGP